MICALLLIAVWALGATDAPYGKITDFSVSDLPDDDGSGLVLKWTPLSKDYRIIKYNIYRGVSPDSLFLLTDLEVDPKLGVLAPHLYYYDSGDQPLIEFETSPTKLKKESGQPADSPLYQKFPIQPKLLHSLHGYYNLLVMTKAKNIYTKSKRVKQEEDTFIGLNLVHTDGIFAIPMADITYYYSVAAVNERGVVLPAADVKSGVPTDNAPDATAILYAAYIQDNGVMNFEWNPPIAAHDIYLWHGWLVPKSIFGDSADLPENWQHSAIPVFTLPNQAANAVYYHSEPFDAKGLDLSNYRAVLSYMDYDMQEAAVPSKNFRILDSSALPALPTWKVMDKPNDKGDGTFISFGKPLAYITIAEYKNRQHKSIRINYEVSKNDNYTVDKVKFSFSTPEGEKIGDVIENYVDNLIELKLPAKYRDPRNLHVTISVKLLKSKEWEKELVTQEIVYNEYFRRFQPSDNYLNGVDISKLYYEVLYQSKVGGVFSGSGRSNALSRSFDHTVAYEDYTFKPIMGYDEATNRFLLDNRFPIALDAENGLYFDAPFYRDLFEAEMKERNEAIQELKDKLAADPENAELQAELAGKEAEWEFITSHPAYNAQAKAKSEKAWRKIMLSWRDKALRSYQYRVLATDGKAAFQISDTYQTEKGESWFYPISEWFDSTKWMTLGATLLMLIILVYAIFSTRRGNNYIRPIAGLEEIDNAIGRATEMGRPVMFVPGWGTIGDVCTIASLMILAQVAKKTAEYDTRLINPHCDYMVLPLAQEIISTSYSEMGRPDSYNQNDIFFISDNQFPFCAGVNGITLRERVATIFYMGFFNAEALLLTETGNQAGSIQVAATDAVTQIPFFITTCDYTLIGEEFYAASAYLSHDVDMLSMLKTQDYFKIFIVAFILIGAILSTLNFSTLIHAFPLE